MRGEHATFLTNYRNAPGPAAANQGWRHEAANLALDLIGQAAIPLSLLAGTLVLESMGHSLNTMTLGGLGIAVGLLVDDAVIVVENTVRDMMGLNAFMRREELNRLLGEGDVANNFALRVGGSQANIPLSRTKR